MLFLGRLLLTPAGAPGSAAPACPAGSVAEVPAAARQRGRGLGVPEMKLAKS